MADGVAQLQSLTANGGADGGHNSLSALTASAEGTPVGAGTLAQLTANGGADGGVASLESVTAAGEQLGTNGTGAGELTALTATGINESATVGEGAPSLERITAEGLGATEVDCVLEAVTGEGEGLTGGLADGAAALRRVTADAVGTGTNPASGDGTLQALQSTGQDLGEGSATAEATLERVQANGIGIAGGVAAGAPSLAEVQAAAVGYPAGVASGAPVMEYMRANGYSEAEIAATYRTWVMNTANEALSEYTNYAFNSYAVFNGKTYGAGPNGLMEIGGADDAGEDIAWTIRTGMMDDKNVNLKRLEELLLSMRYNGPLRIRVWTDEETYYDYTLSNFRANLIHQVRAKLGKGLKSRYFQIEISALNGATCEIESLQVPMVPVARREG